VYYGGNLEIIRLSRQHNDANILSLGARFLSADEAKEAVKLWLETPFSGEERHTRRITQIDQIS
jgi:ribose 5-phosphate isomerase B